MTTPDATTLAFQSHRPRLFGIAYRMLGSAEEAEDTVQDAYLRWRAADRSDVGHPGAFLARTVTRLCLNRLDSARARREVYTGPWLPEPVLTGSGVLGPLESAEQRDQVSMALLVLLEQLTPAERAVYVLREAFGYGHREIAGLLELSEANCRQLYRRAGTRLAGRRPRFTADDGRWHELVDRFLTAAREGDLAGLERLLATDVVCVSDGGDQVSAARRPVVGRDKAARYLLGTLERFAAGLALTPVEVNGGPGVLVGPPEAPLCALALDFRDGLLEAVRTVVNPEKLVFLRGQLSHSGGPSGLS
ncbi:RNA polymerase sigma-70 factor [Streptomyces bambusae]|uniref:RNA polymerase sigma-70 factor n=1 Tax=Streptomyces bambusae TaxID=1550616 RepID=UPI001CFE6ADE|nr:RNA polymerase sigma-70 factor [Streptomyces bambusae]MCB5165273.1 RNA polymerase sigma-70 factor [Streptomyces bambusae]